MSYNETDYLICNCIRLLQMLVLLGLLRGFFTGQKFELRARRLIFCIVGIVSKETGAASVGN